MFYPNFEVLTSCSIISRSTGQKLYTYKQSEVNTKCINSAHTILPIIANKVKLLLSKHTPFNTWWLGTQMTHQPWQCIHCVKWTRGNWWWHTWYVTSLPAEHCQGLTLQQLSVFQRTLIEQLEEF